MQPKFEPTTRPSSNLFISSYKNHHNDLQILIQSINQQGKICVLWNHVRGFLINYQSKIYPLSENVEKSLLSDPKEAIRFIINRDQSNVDYIFEDFHHFLGKQDSISPEIGAIRSLVKDLSISLENRHEKIYFFVPDSYELPLEMTSFFNHINGSKKKTTKGFLDKYGVLLTEQSVISSLKPVIGVDDIIERVIQILSQMETNNPLLIGCPGVGKTAVVEGLATALFNGMVPDNLKQKMLYLLSLNTLVAGTKYRGEFEERLEGLMDEVRANKERIIIFIDEIHTILNAGSAEGGLGAGDILKPVLARGEFPIIGATTVDGAKIFLKDHAFFRRFKKVMINEPSTEEAFKILKGIVHCFEKHHGLKIDDSALMAAVYLSQKYIADEYLPGKAIALIDSAAAYCKMKGVVVVREPDIESEIKKTRQTIMPRRERI
ncbi:MAG: ATP-dependent Clp protease ATP-binding subunit [Desulfobacterales bacterium]|nr:ATP-dependent Clp protease ATP-binding subunit [Desulfobacterales bacterium]